MLRLIKKRRRFFISGSISFRYALFRTFFFFHPFPPSLFLKQSFFPRSTLVAIVKNVYYYFMNLPDKILNVLLSGNSFSYRKLIENGTRPKYSTGVGSMVEIKERTLKTTLSRLKSRGLVGNDKTLWKITKKGVEYIKNNNKKPKHFTTKNINAVKDLIVVFDIPELHKKKRNYLRIELTALGFGMLQKSVWFGPSPLPEEFVKYLNELNLLQYMKFFKAKEGDIV